MTVQIDAPAKVNLRLRVLARETSGYHQIETVFCAVSLCDTLRISAAGDGVELISSGNVADMGPPEQNLVVRAVRVFRRAAGLPNDPLRIELDKRIPIMAGLGGGSSNAAAMLRGLNSLHGEPLDDEALLHLAADLGSDVSFFLCGSPLALGWGRGERLLSLPALPPRPVLIADPGLVMSTGGAFEHLAEARGDEHSPEPSVLTPAHLGDWRSVASIAMNDFEILADQQIPTLPRARAEMRAAGAIIALLAGSGSCLFGVFDSVADRNDAEARVAALGFSTRRADTLDALPAPVLARSSAVDPASPGW